jgi:nitrate/nitrite transporter NarK
MNKSEVFAVRHSIALGYAMALGFVFSVNYTNHAPLVPTLVKELGITFTQAGFLTTAIFLTHGLLQIPGGNLADRLGAHGTGLLSLLIIALGNLAMGFATTYHQLITLKCMVGIGTGLAFISGARYIATFFAGKGIQKAQGLYGAAVVLGAGFVIYGIPVLSALVGWHNIFILTGSLAGLLALFWLFLAPSTPAHDGTAGVSWPVALGNPNIWLLALVQLGSFGTVVSASVWVNTSLIKSFHLPPQKAGMIGSAVLLLGVLSRPLGGALLDGRHLTTRQLLFWSCIGLAIGFTWIGLAENIYLSILGIILTGIMAGLPFAGIFNAAREHCPTRPGMAMGIVNTGGAIGVMILPPVIGRLVDHTGTFISGFLALGLTALLAAGSSLALRKPSVRAMDEDVRRPS